MDLDRIAWSAPVSRRRLLATLGVLGAAVAAGACGTGRSPAEPSRPAASPSRAAGIERALSMYGWPDGVSPDTIDRFKERIGVEEIRYDVRETNAALVATLLAGADGHDLAAPAATSVPRLVEAGLIQRLERDRIPNLRHVDPAFRRLAWDPTDAYQVPKAYGTTGILYRGGLVEEPPASWREFRALVSDARYSGRTVFVDSIDDVLAFPLKLAHASVSSVAKDELDAARLVLLDVAPHLQALDSTGYGERLRSGEAVLALGWAAPLASLRADPAASDTRYVVPSEGTLLWLDTWVLLAGAPHPNAAYAWLDFVHEPEIAAGEAAHAGHATPNRAALDFVAPALLADPAVFPPESVMPRLEGAADTSASAQRRDIWEEFRSKVAAG